MPTVAWMIVAIAFVVRVAWVALVRVDPAGFLDDMWWYHTTAAGIAAGRGYRSAFAGYPTAAWPPGYPLLLGGAYRLFGVDVRTAVIVNAVAGTGACICTWWLARRVTTPRGATVAAALVALLPSHVLFTSLVLSETVFTTALCALVLVAASLLERPPSEAVAAPSWLCWGAAGAAAALIRSEAIVLLFLPSLVTAWTRRAWRDAGTMFLAAAAGAAVLLTPWIYRNARVFGTFVPLSTSLGRTLEIGHNPDATGGMMMLMAGHPDVGGVWSPAEELALDRSLTHAALSFARAHPATEARLFVRKLYLLYRGDHIWLEGYGSDAGTVDRSGLSPRTKALLAHLSNAYYAIVMGCALGAFALSRRSQPARVMMVATIIAWTLVFALIYGSARFHFPLMPFFCVMAAQTLESLRTRIAIDRREGEESP